MKVVIFGSRRFTDYNKLKEVVENSNPYRKGLITNVISGGAGGADALGARWAREQGMEPIIMLADWARYGRGAGHRRNKEMAEIADGAIGFWDGESPGTRNMILECQRRKIPLLVYRTDKEAYLIDNGK